MLEVSASDLNLKQVLSIKMEHRDVNGLFSEECSIGPLSPKDIPKHTSIQGLQKIIFFFPLTISYKLSGEA